MTLSGYLGGFASYVCEHGSLVGAKLYISNPSGKPAERFCTILSADDPRRVRVGARLRVRYEDDGSEEQLKQDDARIRVIAGSVEHREELRQQFSQLDRNKDGTLSISELRAVFEQIVTGKRLSSKGLHRLFDHVDRDGNGAVDIDEFIQWVITGKTLPKRPSRPADSQRAASAEEGSASGVLGISIVFPTKEESDAFVAQQAEEILKDPESFFKDGKVGGRAQLGTVAAMVILSSQPLPGGDDNQKYLNAFRSARPALLGQLDSNDGFFKSAHAAEPKSDEEWQTCTQALASAAYASLNLKMRATLASLGVTK
eukprot:TRINITY_DN22343_c0_g1_i1.p1 TRINITY_DN22343_c0_g1~~TRINITY_DN22343_c0_g1_i1.p1  ORF type:complete len:314 (+),score=53.87 TRINITY_DN22343_c0_g1_i1:60-1001(+)